MIASLVTLTYIRARREDRGEKPFLKNILILNRRNGK